MERKDGVPGMGLHHKGALKPQNQEKDGFAAFLSQRLFPPGLPARYGSQTPRGATDMRFKKVSVPPATSKGAGGHERKKPLQESRGGGFRPGRRAFAPTDDAGTSTIQRPCHHLDRPPSARSVFGCSRVSPTKALPVEALAPGFSEPIRELTKPPQPHSRSSSIPRDRSQKGRRIQ